MSVKLSIIIVNIIILQFLLLSRFINKIVQFFLIITIIYKNLYPFTKNKGSQAMRTTYKGESQNAFERKSSLIFKRTLSPKFWKQSRREKSKLSVQPHRLDQLHLTTNTIQFFFRGGHGQFVYNRELKLINKTGTRIGFKIKSNNPQNYQVTPSQAKIEDKGICEIRIRLYVQTANLTKYWMDKFLIQWGALDDLTGDPIYTQKAYLKVQVTTDMSTIRTQTINQNVVASLKQISYYQQLIDKNKQTIDKLQGIIIQKERMPKQWVISYSMGVFLAIVSFLIGYLIF